MKIKAFIIMLLVLMISSPVTTLATPCNEMTDLTSSMSFVESLVGSNYHYSLTFSNTTINPDCAGYGIEEVDILYNSTDPSFVHEGLPVGWLGDGIGDIWNMTGGVAPAYVPPADLVHIILPGSSLSGFKFYSNQQLTGISSYGFDYVAWFRAPSSVPEPGTIILLGVGLTALSLYRRLRLKRTA